MVKRNNYPQEYKNKLSAEIYAGTSPAVISKRENIGVQTLNKWKANYPREALIEHMSKAEITEMRKKLSELSMLYADAIKGLKETRLNQVIVGDVTQYCVNGKVFFLATLMDRYNREVIGRAISDSNNTGLVFCALNDAIRKKGAMSLNGCIHHTETDVRYYSIRYIQKLRETKMKISMCLGNANENAHAESLFKTIKYQEINVSAYDDKIDSAIKIFDYIERYNTRRPHSALGGLSPVEFRNKINAEKDKK